MDENEVGDYRITGSLGSGESSKVKLAQHKVTGEFVAIKMFPKLDNDPIRLAKIHREAAILRIFDHPHIVRLINVFESQRLVHVVMELAENRELCDLMTSERQLPVPLAMRLFRQIIYALEYMHEFGICHRDLKPENIFLDYAWNIKVGDFGFAAWLRSESSQESCGSPHYAAPEVIRGSCYSGEAVDVWSCGVILFAMLAGYLPFDDPDLFVCMEQIKLGHFEMPNFHPDICDLISRMLTVDPTARIRIKDIKAHPAFGIGLPIGYAFPSPIPASPHSDPVDVALVDPKILKVLTEVGFTEAELAMDLRQPWHTPGKLFLQAITKSVALEQLPWTDARKCKLVVCSPAPVVSIGHPEPAGRVGSADPFKRGQKLEAADELPVKYSWATIPDWIVEEKAEIIYAQEREFEDLQIPCDVLVGKLQNLLTGISCDWFFPDDTRIIARHPSGAFLTLDVVHQCAERVGDQMIDTVTLFVRMSKGTADVFEEIGCMIMKELAISV